MVKISVLEPDLISVVRNAFLREEALLYNKENLYQKVECYLRMSERTFDALKKLYNTCPAWIQNIMYSQAFGCKIKRDEDVPYLEIWIG